MTKHPRYDGAHFLRLVECYVLAAIGQLSTGEIRQLEEMTPKLRSTYKASGSWQEVVASALDFPPNMPILIQDLWAKNQAIARGAHAVLTPQEFAEMFVDQNVQGET